MVVAFGPHGALYRAPPRWNRLVAMTRDCKSLAFGLRRFESYFQHQRKIPEYSGIFLCQKSPKKALFLLTNFKKCATMEVILDQGAVF